MIKICPRLANLRTKSRKIATVGIITNYPYYTFLLGPMMWIYVNKIAGWSSGCIWLLDLVYDSVYDSVDLTIATILPTIKTANSEQKVME